MSVCNVGYCVILLTSFCPQDFVFFLTILDNVVKLSVALK